MRAAATTARRVGLAVIAVAALAGCASALPTPADADAARATSLAGAPVTLAQLQAGRATYVARCASCHHLFLPADYPPEAWPDLVSRMADRARLQPADRAAIERYLVVMAGRPR